MGQSLQDALKLAKGPCSRQALRYSYVMKGVVERAKEPGYTKDDWAALAELVATDDFERVGNFREKVAWDQYLGLLDMWGRSTVWDFRVRRVTEGDGYALLELEEHAVYPDREETYCSVSVYEFDAAGKLVHLEIYLSKEEALGAAQSHRWDWEEVSAEIV